MRLLFVLDLGTRWGESGQRHALAVTYPLPGGKGPPAHIGEEAGWAPKQGSEEKSFAPTEDRTLVVQFEVRHKTK